MILSCSELWTCDEYRDHLAKICKMQLQRAHSAVKPGLSHMHRQSDQTICACRSIGERGPEEECGQLAHVGAAPVLVEGRREEGDLEVGAGGGSTRGNNLH